LHGTYFGRLSLIACHAVNCHVTTPAKYFVLGGFGGSDEVTVHGIESLLVEVLK